MYQKLFFDVLEISIIVSLIVLLIVILLPVIEKRYGFRWRKFLWLVLAVRLLVPYNFSLPDTPVKLFESEKIVVQDGVHIYFTEYAPTQETNTASHINSEDQLEKVKTKSDLPKDAFQIPLLVLLGIVWGIGVFVYLRNQQLNYGYFLKDLEECVIVTGGRRYERLKEVCERLQVRRVPDLYISEKVMTPCIAGCFRPVMLLPDRQFTDRELEFIFLHECTHYKKHDLLYKFVIIVAVGIHWFNPAIHYMKKFAFRDVELVCDKSMVKSMSQQEKKLYCSTLINTASGYPFKEMNLSTNFIGNKKILKQRIENIFDKTKRRKGVIPITLILAVMLLGGASISCGKHVALPKVEESDKKITQEKKTKKETAKRSIPFTLPVTEKEKEWLAAADVNSLEPFYCKEGRNWRSDYWIDEDGILWEHDHSIAENVVHMRAEHDYEGEPILYYLTKDGKLHSIDKDGNNELFMEDVTYFTCDTTFMVILKEDGSVWTQGIYRSPGYQYVENDPINSLSFPVLRYEEMTCVLKNAKYITSHNNTVAAITEDEKLVTWGSALYGECGPDDKEMDILAPDKRVEDVEFVWFDEAEERMYIRKKDGSFWVCGEEVGAKKKKISYGPEGGVKERICTEQLMPLILKTE